MRLGRSHSRKLFLTAVALLFVGCSSTREFWNYVVEKDVEKPRSNREEGEEDTQYALSPHNVKVVYNDGSKVTEVLIPVLTSGQQIVVDHKGRPAGAGLTLVPLPPTEADKSLEESYVQSGQPVQAKSAPVSIVKTQEKVKELTKEGNYSLALQYIEQLLQRYPNHVKSLRTKGSLLMKLGERDAALKAYYKAQEIEPDPRVATQINKLEKAIGQ